MNIYNLQISLQIIQILEINQGSVIKSADYFYVIYRVTKYCLI